MVHFDRWKSYEQILEQGKASGVVMRKLIRQRNAPPKAPKEKKARKPRAKKEEAAGGHDRVHCGEEGELQTKDVVRWGRGGDVVSS